MNNNEIPKYVAVGINPEYSVSVKKETFDTGFILFTLIYGACLIIVLIFIVFLSFNATGLSDIPLVITINKNNNDKTLQPDASSLYNKAICNSTPNASFINDKCVCNFPYFGPSCQLEKTNSNYIPIGIPDESAINFNIIESKNTKYKSFTPSSVDSVTCSDLCSNTSHTDCIGFLYSNSVCTLLYDNVFVPSNFNIPYSSDIDSTLYLKSTDSLIFDNRVFISSHVSFFPPRFWLTSPGSKKYSNFLHIIPQNIYSIDFFPTYYKYYNNNLTGLYCLFSFSFFDVDYILNNQHLETYIHNPLTDLSLPISFQDNRIFLMYF